MIAPRSTERDLIEVLRVDARDVSGPDDLVLRRPAPAPRGAASRWGRAAGTLLAAAAVVVEIVVLMVVMPAHQHARTPVVPAASGPTVPVSLAPSREYAVSSVQVLPDRAVLYVTYQPGPFNTYEGGTITLYGPGVFAATSFLTTADDLTVAGHAGFFGTYDHRHVLAWPVPAGRWVAVAGFHGSAGGTDPGAVRRASLAVAALVRVP